MDTDSILRRIHKLLAIAADARGDANEAAAAASQAEKLMRKFNIDHADVLRRELLANAKSQMGTVRVKCSMKRDDPTRPALKRAPKWAGWLAVELALLNDTQAKIVYDASLGGVVIEFRGVSSDAQVAGWMFDSLVGQMIIGVRNWTAAQRKLTGAPPSKEANNAFRVGFVSALLVSLREMRKGKDAEMAQAAESRALVVCKAAAVAEHFGDVKYKAGKAVTVNDERAYVQGHAAGAKVDVRSRAVSAARSDQLAIR